MTATQPDDHHQAPTESRPQDGWNADVLEEIQGQEVGGGRPILFTDARILTGDPVIGDFDSGDVLVGGGVFVGVGPGLITAAGDDRSIVVVCTGMTILPPVVDTVALQGFRRSRDAHVATLVPGGAADLAIIPSSSAATLAAASGILLSRPEEVTVLVAGGEVVRWGGADVVAAPAATPAGRKAQDLTGNARLGVWIDETGFLHQELTADGRYDETRGGRPHAFQGRFWLDGDRIEYLDDLGFWSFGTFTGDRLHHASYVLRLH